MRKTITISLSIIATVLTIGWATQDYVHDESLKQPLHFNMENNFSYLHGSWPKCVRRPIMGGEEFHEGYPTCDPTDIGWLSDASMKHATFHWREGISQQEKDYARPFLLRNGMNRIDEK